MESMYAPNALCLTGYFTPACSHYFCQQRLGIRDWQHDVRAYTPSTGPAASSSLPFRAQLCQRSHGQAAYWLCGSFQGFFPAYYESGKHEAANIPSDRPYVFQRNFAGLASPFPFVDALTAASLTAQQACPKRAASDAAEGSSNMSKIKLSWKRN